MELTTRASSFAWVCLMWKELQQIKPIFVAVVVTLLCIQLICGAVMQVLPSAGRIDSYQIMLVVSGLGPFLGALASCGMLFGHERQTGTWNWSSSLPIPWKQALTAKLIASLVVCLALLATLTAIPLFLLLSGPIPEAELVMPPAYVLFNGGFILLELFVILVALTLLMQDALTAMVTGCAILIALHSIPAVFTIREVMSGGGNATLYPSTVWNTLVSLSLLVGTIGMILVFRWRWGTGQSAQLLRWKSSLPAATTMATALAATSLNLTPARLGVAPSQKAMLWQLSWRNSLMLRLAIVLSTFALVAINKPYLPDDSGMTLRFALNHICAATCLLGLTAFLADQMRERYRFLSDRGVSPRILMWSRLGPPLVIATLLLVATVAWYLFTGPFPGSTTAPNVFECWGYLLCFASLFLVGAFSSLSFRSNIVAAVVAIVTAGAAAVLLGMWVAIKEELIRISSPTIVDWFVLPAGFIVTPVILFTGIYLSSPRWIIDRDAPLHRRYLWCAALALLLPFFIDATFGYLSVPKVAWQGATLQEVDAVVHSRPAIEKVAKLFGDLEVPQLFDEPDSADNALIELNEQLSNTEQLDSLLTGCETRVNQMLDVLSGPMQADADPVAFDRDVGRWIEETALLAKLAMQHGRVELSKRAWRCNRMLQQSCDPITWMKTKSSRQKARTVWTAFGMSEIQALGGRDFTAETMLPAQHDATMGDQLQRIAATVTRELVRGNPSIKEAAARTAAYRTVSELDPFLRFYPPLRWRVERGRAAALAGSLE